MLYYICYFKVLQAQFFRNVTFLGLIMIKSHLERLSYKCGATLASIHTKNARDLILVGLRSKLLS